MHVQEVSTSLYSDIVLGSNISLVFFFVRNVMLNLDDLDLVVFDGATVILRLTTSKSQK